MNRVELIGRLTKNIEVRKIPSGESTTSFSLAVNRDFAKEGQVDTDFINCVAWKQSADYLGSYAHKGTLISVEGRIQTRNYEGQNGKVYITEVRCDRVSILRQPEGNQQSQQKEAPHHNYPQENQNNRYKDYGTAQDDFSNTTSLDISSDDLPFY